MSLFGSILHPTDFSPSSAAARPLAFELARHSEQFLVLYVDVLFSGTAGAETEGFLRDYSEGAPQVAEPVIARDVTPAQGIIAKAAEEDVDLIVMGTHGRRGLSRLLLGSTAREVVQLAPCPVLTVKDGAEGRALPTLQGKSVLAAVDFTEASLAALTEATRLARALDARLDVVLVVEPPPPYKRYPTYAAYDPEPDEAFVTRVREDLRRLRDGVAAEHHLLGHVEVTWGAPAREIARVAGDLESALVVVGTRGLRGAERLLLGSVAEALVRTAPCPVLTVKDGEALDEARDVAAELARRSARNAEQARHAGRPRSDRALTWPPAPPPQTERAR